MSMVSLSPISRLHNSQSKSLTHRTTEKERERPSGYLFSIRINILIIYFILPLSVAGISVCFFFSFSLHFLTVSRLCFHSHYLTAHFFFPIHFITSVRIKIRNCGCAQCVCVCVYGKLPLWLRGYYIFIISIIIAFHS